jgi:zinc transport system substrate-binding protein
MRTDKRATGPGLRGLARRLAFSLAAGAILAATSGVALAQALTVYTVNYPLAYFTERIGGDQVRVVLPAPPDGDPAAWTPAAPELEAFRKADLIVLNGAGYEPWAEGAGLPKDRVVQTSASFADKYLTTEEEDSHTHADGSTHSHDATIAFTIWLDPKLALIQATAIRDALSAKRPAAASQFKAGFEALEADLMALDGELAAVFAKLGDDPVVFSHPVYQYLQARYGINAISVHWEPGEKPGQNELMKLAVTLPDHPAELMIWEGPPVSETTEALVRMAVESVVMDPCANRPAEGDYLSVMRQNVENLRAAIGS